MEYTYKGYTIQITKHGKSLLAGRVKGLEVSVIMNRTTSQMDKMMDELESQVDRELGLK